MIRKILNSVKKSDFIQTNIEEYFNGISHGIAAIGAVVGFVLLVIYGAMHTASWSLFSTIVYGLCLIFLFTVSSVYHIVKNVKLKKIMRIADHAGIFFMIAGTYTPVLLLTGKGEIKLFFIQWLLALLGLVLKIFYTGKFEIISLMLYVVMGWLGIFIIDDLYAILPRSGFWLMISGGIAYTAGILFYALDEKIKFAHFIWHLFVMKGSLLHFLMILLYLL